MNTATHPRLALAAVVLAALGCGTIRSTYYGTDECSPFRQTKRLRGIPTTIDVPTHVKLTVYEKRYVLPAPDTTSAELFPSAANPLVTRRVGYELVTMKELYTVNILRPAAGDLDYKIEFDGQEIKQLKYDRSDVTIQKVSTLIATLIRTIPTLKALGTSTTGGGGPQLDKTLIELETVAACEIFDLRGPGLEAKVQAFLEHYVNACTLECPAPLILPTEPLHMPRANGDKAKSHPR